MCIISGCLRIDDKIDDKEKKPDEIGIVDFISNYLIQELQGCNYSVEAVRQIMMHVTEIVVEKFSIEIEAQEKLPLDEDKRLFCPINRKTAVCARNCPGREPCVNGRMF